MGSGTNKVVPAPEGRQILQHRLCRPSGAADINAVLNATAYAVGYFLAPLRGSGSPRVFRLTRMGLKPWATFFRRYGAVTSGLCCDAYLRNQTLREFLEEL